MNSTTSTSTFDQNLLDCIRLRKNQEAASMLKKDMRDKVDPYWRSLLHYSILHENEEMIRLLIDLGWDIDLVKNNPNRTPLMSAVEWRRPSIVNILLDANANFSITNDDGKNAIEMAFELDNFNPFVIQAFLRTLRRATPTIEELVHWMFQLKCSLYEATFLKDIEVIEYMMKYGLNVGSRGRLSRTALHAAVEMVDLKLVQWFLERNAEVDAKDFSNMTPLSLLYAHARKHTPEHIEIFKLLLSRGANLNCYNVYGWPLSWSIVKYGNVDALRLLFQSNVDFTMKTEEDGGKTLLHTLVENKNPGVVQGLQDVVNLDVDVTDRRGKSVLYYAVTKVNTEMVEFLLEHEAKTNYKNTRFSPLFRAFSARLARRNKLRATRCVQLLLEYGANPQILEYHIADPTIFEYAEAGKCYRKINLVIARLAEMEAIGTPINDHEIWHIGRIPRFQKYLDSCRRLLKSEVVESLTVIELLLIKNNWIRMYLHDDRFVNKIRRICCNGKFRAKYSFYFEILKENFFRVSIAMRLEYAAVVAVREIFGVCYIVAKKIVGYLDECDLERLC